MNLSRNQIQKLIRDKKILVKGKGIKPAFILYGGEEIIIEIPENEPIRMTPENMQLDIKFEDEYIIVVNKPPHIVVHPARGHLSGTLVNALLGHCSNLSCIGGEMRPGVVHRLDKDTSGLIIFAKNEIAHKKLSSDLSQRKIHRQYYGLVWGSMKNNIGTIEAPIGHNPKDHKRMAVENSGKPARTDYSVISDFKIISAINFKLFTGRTHQIRVHCAYLGHPIFADKEYGGSKERIKGYSPEYRIIAKELLEMIDRQALHAWKLEFEHPITREYLKIETDIPDDISLIIKHCSLNI